MTSALSFKNETEFETSVITNLTQNHGWDKNVLNYPTERDLLDNWAENIFTYNRASLNNVPLSEAEKDQLLLKVSNIETTADVQRLLQGMNIEIIRDNPADTANHGNSVFVSIFDPLEVCGGKSSYQIARQPRLDKRGEFDKDRRGDFLLLIRGIPVIHVELKNSGRDVNDAIRQMKTYASEGMYSGIMNMVQVNVAMTPHDMRYLARPDSLAGYDADVYHFQWANSDNEIVTEWKDVIAQFLGIPYAHELVGSFLVADKGDGILKAMRPYQIHAANEVRQRMRTLNRVSRADWDRSHQKGGYVWHTTGSGKTMTSFKTAQLLVGEHLADRVILVLDRTELSKQTLDEFRNFATPTLPIASTPSTRSLAATLWKDNDDSLVITMIHKLANICDPKGSYAGWDFTTFKNQRIVFILDEAHRSVHKDMFAHIQRMFPYATFFGFTGTPIQEINAKNGMDTVKLFGNELHRYNIVYGMRDGNVLGFDLKPVATFDYSHLRREVALRAAHATSLGEVYADPAKKAVFEKYISETDVPWALEEGDNGESIEALIPDTQWTDKDKHHSAVVNYILDNWAIHSSGNMFHGMLAAESVEEAVAYYRLFQEHNKAVDAYNDGTSEHKPASMQKLRVTAVFSDLPADAKGSAQRGKAIADILSDYKDMYGLTYTRESDSMAEFRKNVAHRLAHKRGYREINPASDQRLDLVIVVEMMLTGYDSKFVNTLYLDQMTKNEHLIQAMSRTNRVWPGKSHGIIAYFRKIHTTELRIDAAISMYSDGQPLAVFVDPLPTTFKTIAHTFESIKLVFESDNIRNFSQLPETSASRRKFAIEFAKLSQLIERATLQGFSWDNPRTVIDGGIIEAGLTKDEFEVLQQRYNELGSQTKDPDPDDVPIPLDLHALAIARESKRIDFEYLNAKMSQLQQALRAARPKEELDNLRSEVQRTYARLPQDDQAVARMILQDIETGKIEVSEHKTFSDWLNDYKSSTQDSFVDELVTATGVNADEVNKILVLSGTPTNGGVAYYEQFGLLKHLIETVDRSKFSEWLKVTHGVDVAPWYVQGFARQLFEKFFDNEGFDINEWEPES